MKGQLSGHKDQLLILWQQTSVKPTSEDKRQCLGSLDYKQHFQESVFYSRKIVRISGFVNLETNFIKKKKQYNTYNRFSEIYPEWQRKQMNRI